MRKGAGRYPQPVALLARLGVDVDHEGSALGAGMLRDVISRDVPDARTFGSGFPGVRGADGPGVPHARRAAGSSAWAPDAAPVVGALAEQVAYAHVWALSLV